MSFLHCYFKLGEEFSGEQTVCCPFPHTKADGTTYYDNTPSMCINLDKGVYKCQSCGAKGNDVQMCRELWNTTEVRARNICRALRDNFNIKWRYEEGDSDDTEVIKDYMAHLGVTEDMMHALGFQVHDTGTPEPKWLFPVVYNDYVLDVREYQHGRQPKVLSMHQAPTGAVIPHDQAFAEDKNRWIILCAGEKDMMVTRARGLNAITFTGGEMCNNIINPSDFSGRRIAVCYDNDQAGRTGAHKIAQVLLRAGAEEVRVVTKFHDDFPAKDTKEDMTDWFVSYDGSKEKLIEYIKETPPEELITDLESEIRKLTLSEAKEPEFKGQIVKTQVQIISVSDDVYQVPKTAKITWYSKKEGKYLATEWSLEDTPEVIPSITGVLKNVRDNAIVASIPEVESKSACVLTESRVTDPVTNMKKLLCRPVANVVVATVTQSNCSAINKIEMPMFFVGCYPVQGKVYDVTSLMWQLTNGAICGICYSCEDAVAISNEINDDQLASLIRIKNWEGTVADKVAHRADAVRGLLGVKANLEMIELIDLTLNSVCEVRHKGSYRKGYLDTLIIGESRIGKSLTATKLVEAYGVGQMVSLAGSAATEQGIIGGSAKDATGKMSTRAGVLPRSNGQAIIFEELSKAPDNLLRHLTDVRSSGLSRISRVTGTIEMPTAVRMCSLSNQKPGEDGNTLPLTDYPDGIKVVQQLIGTSEDIARYDAICLVGNPEDKKNYIAPEPIAKEDLQNAITWVWSRTRDQIVINDSTIDRAEDWKQKLNDKYPLNVKLFGTECDLKLLRIASAVAAYVISASDDYSKIIVTPECVDWAAKYLIKIYDNQLFKISEVVQRTLIERTVTPESTKKLQDFYAKYHEAIDYLYKSRILEQSTFQDLTGATPAEIGPMIRDMLHHNFINKYRGTLTVTAKFINTYPLLKQMEVPKC